MPASTAAPLAVSEDDRRALVRLTRSTRSPRRAVVQARALLWAAAGLPNGEIARRCDVDADTVRRWRRRFQERGVEGVGVIAKGRGRKPWLPEGTAEEVIRVTLEEHPDAPSAHWTTRSLARRMGVGKDTVARIWREHELEPWRLDHSTRPDGPSLGERLVNGVDRCMHRPGRGTALVLDGGAPAEASSSAAPG